MSKRKRTRVVAGSAADDGIHGTMPEPELMRLVTSRKNKLGAMVDNVATTVDNIGRSSGGGHDNLTLAVVETSTKSILKTRMTKQTRYILLGLATAIVLSITLNIVQCTSTPKEQPTVNPTDSHTPQHLRQDTILLQSISEQLERITTPQNKQSKEALDSIRRIINKNQKQP